MADSGGAPPAVSEETSPDLLKNTPWNIARLEDVIEHCQGRQKYLAHTTSPSDGGDARWYFCKVPLGDNGQSFLLFPFLLGFVDQTKLAASVPRTEIVGKGDYFRFGMRDSLAIEASFLQNEEELLSCWWKEYAECSEGPRCQPSTSTKVDGEKNEYSSESAQEVEEERVGVPVKGGLYEVDLVKRHCFPVYWNGENRRVLRGHWFARKGGLDWLPIREDVAEQLEMAYRRKVWHRRTFQPSGLFAARIDMHGSTPGLHALFTGEDDTWEAWLNVDASGFSGFLSLSGSGIKLRRGYSASDSAKPTQDELRQRKEEEMDDYCSQVPVQHVVFMVHGIGQRLEKSNLVDDVANFRHITASLAERHLTPHQLGAQRVLFIPCQWRKGLRLSGESAVEKITLDGVRGLRVTLSATVHDVLYYMSPIYCQDIINSVSNQLNRLYLKFLKRNPGYNGKVSLYGHSLGSVLSYDILCHQENLSSPFPMDWMYNEHPRNEDSVDHHLSVGKPLMNLEGNTPNVINEAKDKVDSVDEEHSSTQSTLEHEDGEPEDLPTIASPLTSNPTTETASEPSQSGGEGVTDFVNDFADLSPDQRDHLNEAAELEFVESTIGLEGMAPEECKDNSNQQQITNMLREEIDALKAKIAELESMCDGGDGIGWWTLFLQLDPLLESFLHSETFVSELILSSYKQLFVSLLILGKGKEYWAEENIDEEMPACLQMFNIFHPFDPVAYRIEPLVCKEYVSKRPVIIPYHRGGRRLHIGFQEFSEDLAARSQAIIGHINSVKVKVITACHSRNMNSMDEEEENCQENEERTYGSIMMERLTGSEEGRIDHMLQDKTFEHPYLQAIGSHTNYWRDHDTALFILKHLYKDIPEEANSQDEDSSGGNSKEQMRSTPWSEERENAEEELPLTFSDDMMVRSFSRKVKKFMKRP
ncbi:hypothetical protein Tsubulata_034436 [Turnera subulata]|uniref:DDHD domain-containing protein n=1 Tax=Turnera subulata TaxID=218843 RepID=A0A9Q0G5Q6_9ROSI|nr:hypothetical protein Tsubulata_034436 [Turnera subulata]